MSIKCHPCEMGSQELAYAAISHDFTARGPFDRRKFENARWKKIRKNWADSKKNRMKKNVSYLNSSINQIFY